MPYKTVSHSLYAEILTSSLLLFVDSIRLYSEFETQAVHNPKILIDPAMKKGVVNIIETIEICGCGLEQLPQPPYGGETADRHFRDLGKDMRAYARLLKDLAAWNPDLNKQHVIDQVQAQSERIKHRLHEAIQEFVLIYPEQVTSLLLHSQSTNPIPRD